MRKCTNCGVGIEASFNDPDKEKLCSQCYMAGLTLAEKYELITGEKARNKQGEPNINFVKWLEETLESEHKKGVTMSGDLGQAFSEIGEKDRKIKQQEEEILKLKDEVFEANSNFDAAILQRNKF